MTTHNYNLAANFTPIDSTELSGNAVNVSLTRIFGGTAIAGGASGSYVAANAYDNDIETRWTSNTTGANWLGYDFGATQTITKYAITAWDTVGYLPSAWVIEGANSPDFAGAVTLHTVTGESSFSANERREYTLTATGAYRYYRWRATVSGQYQVIMELEWLALSSGTFLINDSGELYLDAGGGKAFDNSTSANTTTPAATYQYADYDSTQSFSSAADADSNASWNGSWLSLAQLQAVGDTDKRYRYLKCHIDGAGDYSSFSVDDYTTDVTPPDVPSSTKFSAFETDNYAMIWDEPGDSDFDHCELKRVVDGTTTYLVEGGGCLPEWAASGTMYTFSSSGGSADCSIAGYVDKDVSGANIVYYVRSVDQIGNASSWQIFSAGTGPGAPTPPALAATDKADGNGATAVVSGADSGTTNTVYSMPVGGSSWTARGSVVGNDSLDVSLADGFYWLKVQSAGSGGVSLGNVIRLWTTSGSTSPEEIETYFASRLGEYAPLLELLPSTGAVTAREPSRRGEFPAVCYDYAQSPTASQHAPREFSGRLTLRLFATDTTMLDRLTGRIDDALEAHTFDTANWTVRRVGRVSARTSDSGYRPQRGEPLLERELVYEAAAFKE